MKLLGTASESDSNGQAVGLLGYNPASDTA